MITDGLNPIAVLLFVGAVLAGVALVTLYIFARVTKRALFARITLRTVLAGVGVYVLLLLGSSILSHSRVLAPGAEKHICEIDCHLAYSVVGTKAEPLPSGALRQTVTVRVRFDEQTISARRSRTTPLTPNSRFVALVDGQGHQYRGSTDGLRRALEPGESYTTDVVFDVPATAQGLRLVLRSNDPETTFIIGHENSLLHGRTMFALAKAS
jgi:hypothetical protein